MIPVETMLRHEGRGEYHVSSVGHTRKMVNYVWRGLSQEKSLVDDRGGSDVQIDRRIWAWGRKTNRTI